MSSSMKEILFRPGTVPRYIMLTLHEAVPIFYRGLEHQRRYKAV